jgi:hypothetical protein
VGTHKGERQSNDWNENEPYIDYLRSDSGPGLRLGQELRVVFVAVGGGAIRVGREIARQHLRYVESVAINCDPKVQGFEDFDRRVCLSPESGAEVDTGGSAVVGAVLARAAEPSLQRIFRGAAFVVMVGSLGGGAGSGAFPYILDVAARNTGVVSAFVIKPFRCEGNRRALAERAIGRLHLCEAFAEKSERGNATLQVLDNERLVASMGHLAFGRVAEHWASVIRDHLETAILTPAEAILGPAHMHELVESAVATPSVDTVEVPFAPPPTPAPSPLGPAPLPAAHAAGATAELTFEVVSEARPPTAS